MLVVCPKIRKIIRALLLRRLRLSKIAEPESERRKSRSGQVKSQRPFVGNEVIVLQASSLPKLNPFSLVTAASTLVIRRTSHNHITRDVHSTFPYASSTHLIASTSSRLIFLPSFIPFTTYRHIHTRRLTNVLWLFLTLPRRVINLHSITSAAIAHSLNHISSANRFCSLALHLVDHRIPSKAASPGSPA